MPDLTKATAPSGTITTIAAAAPTAKCRSFSRRTAAQRRSAQIVTAPEADQVDHASRESTWRECSPMFVETGLLTPPHFARNAANAPDGRWRVQRKRAAAAAASIGSGQAP